MLVNEHKKLGLDITPIGFANKEISMSGLDESFDKAAKMKYNVIFPSGKEIDYIPMIDYQVSETETINEVDVIKRAVEQDKKNPLKHVTIFYFYSPPGLGKTVLGAYLAKIYNCPYQIVNCVSSMIDLDLLGNHVLLNDRSVWQDGPIPAIIRATNEYGMGILILNELNALTVNAQMALNPLMDKQECVVLTQNNNEVVKVNDNAHLIIFASMNPDVMG
ncbi:MAG: AAA family ATPase, partial [Promethearchaeota archaeon]